LSHALGQRRIGWLLLGFVVLLLAGAVRAFQLTTVDSSHLSGLASQEHTATITVPAARGEITDRNGAILAVSEPADDITASPRTIRHPAAAAAALAPLLNMSPAAITAALAHGSPTYAMLARQVAAPIAAQVKKLGIGGIYLVSDPRRVYPDGYLAGPVLGGVHSDGSGAGGIEARYNGVLTGTPGVQHVVYDANGTPIHEKGAIPVAGRSVQLTLDAAIQKKVEQVLTQTANTFHPQYETAIVLDPRTNAILADANWPLRSSADWAVQLNYEPGSTYKVVAIGGALADGLISPRTTFTIPDTYRVADRVIHDSEIHPTEVLSTTQILARSSNIGAVQIGEKLVGESPATNRFYDWTLRFGFGAPTGVDLPGEEQGLVPSPQQWSGSSIGNLPIGQGESVTPMQMAVAYSAIANGGIVRPPHIVQSVGGAPVGTQHGHRIFTPTVAAELTRMLEDVFGTTGTASEIHIPGYRLAGKTGTANMVVNGTYSNRDYVASFVGFAPASHPQLEAIVVVQRPSTGFVYGTEVAAPAWKQIMDFALPYLKIAP
jgi:cell division protein FtsI/penicillin-binding protein 2